MLSSGCLGSYPNPTDYQLGPLTSCFTFLYLSILIWKLNMERIIQDLPSWSCVEFTCVTACMPFSRVPESLSRAFNAIARIVTEEPTNPT